jgi:hypothetical protein
VELEVRRLWLLLTAGFNRPSTAVCLLSANEPWKSAGFILSRHARLPVRHVWCASRLSLHAS